MANDWKEKTNKDFNEMVNVREKKGQETVGVYKGCRIVERDEQSSTVHSIDIKGKTFDFWGTGQLNYLLKDVEEGTEVKIVYNGLEKITMKKNGRKMTKECHQFQLYTK